MSNCTNIDDVGALGNTPSAPRRSATVKLLPVVVLALGLAMPSLAAAQAPDEELRAGVDEVKAGDFKGGAVTLDRVVERLSNAPGHKQELAAAYLYLGIAQAGLGQETLAK